MNDRPWNSIDEGKYPAEICTVIVKTAHGEMQAKYIPNPEDPVEGFVVPADLARGEITHWKYPY
ncbi:hypothetical protein J5837_15075 [Pseudoxanthomonas helianthi]|uniref:Uncharacterized protein n=1 Tax=Pseudoxanthomonas helianthi TaxID=1453541 RepID=A0A940X5S2_9GAMM|nr:hypothetical protein [Pseudoxanthomonas helianthi]MBP3985731.1 hypothetical protein [Pseudoxanthomonas helianthi]